MSRWMLQKLDYVTIMAYRDQALSHGGIVDVVKNEIETAIVKRWIEKNADHSE